MLEYDGEIRGSIVDLTDCEAYTNFRIANATGFSAEIRQKFVDLLLDIRENCCRNLYFTSEQAQRISEYIFETYGDAPEFLWPNIPSYGAYRKNGKWYAIIGRVPLHKLNPAADADREVEVINVKVDSGRIEGLFAQKGYYPAFHMNKKHWVSILLDDTLPDTEIHRLIEDSRRSV